MPDSWAFREISGANLPHTRYYSSLARIAEGLASSCGYSFSTGCGHGGRQAARRLFRRPDTTIGGLLAGHYQQTAARCAEHELVLCAQDTTYLDFTTHPSTSGLGPLGTPPGRGLLGHSVLAITPEGMPLGLLHVELWARDLQDCMVGASEEAKQQRRRSRSTAQKESVKWLNGLKAVTQALPTDRTALLIQDREADVFDLLAAPRRAKIHLLIRACQPRRVELLDEQQQTNAGRTTLLEAIEMAPIAGEMSVCVPRKQGQAERMARLNLQSRLLRVRPPKSGVRDGAGRPQTVTVIRAAEVDPPPDQDAICWVLITTMTVEDGSAAKRFVGYYARRWAIERLHYTLKSGCRVERLQIDDGHALRNALALYYLVAWRLMWLTHLARTEPTKPASEVLRQEELQVLQAAAPAPVITVQDALREIARMAGYEPYANSPPPGIKRIWQGIVRLEALTYGWSLAQQKRE